MLSVTERFFIECPYFFEDKKGKAYAKKIRHMIRKKLIQTAVDFVLIAEYELKHRQSYGLDLFNAIFIRDGFKCFFQKGCFCETIDRHDIDQLKIALGELFNFIGLKGKSSSWIKIQPDNYDDIIMTFLESRKKKV